VYVAILYYLDDFINYPTTSVGNLLRQSTSTWIELTDKLVVPRNDNKYYNKNYVYIQGTAEDTLLKEFIEVTNNSSICLITHCAINAHLNNRDSKK